MTPNKRHWLVRLMAAGGCLAAMGLTGCQGQYGGQNLPSPNYMLDDVQYYAPGPDFKLTREAAAMKAFAEDQELLGQ